MSDPLPPSYTIKADWMTGGGVTFLCPTPDILLGKLRSFEHSQYRDIRMFDPHGKPLTEADVRRLIAMPDDAGAPLDVDALKAPVLAA